MCVCVCVCEREREREREWCVYVCAVPTSTALGNEVLSSCSQITHSTGRKMLQRRHVFNMHCICERVCVIGKHNMHYIDIMWTISLPSTSSHATMSLRSASGTGRELFFIIFMKSLCSVSSPCCVCVREREPLSE